MAFNRSHHFKRSTLSQAFDRGLDQFIATGRQFVDGVSGARPGQRKNGNLSRFSAGSIERVGRWVGDKVEWLLEDEDDWVESWQSSDVQQTSRNKKPLKAISRRGSNSSKRKELSISSLEDKCVEEEWPDESSFRLNRWQRPLAEGTNSAERLSSSINRQSLRSQRRLLPRSSRKRAF